MSNRRNMLLFAKRNKKSDASATTKGAHFNTGKLYETA